MTIYQHIVEYNSNDGIGNDITGLSDLFFRLNLNNKVITLKNKFSVNNDIIKVNTEIIEHEKQIIDNKFKEFCTNNNVKSSVGHLLTKIYEKNNEEALNIAQKVITYSKTMDNQIGF